MNRSLLLALRREWAKSSRKTRLQHFCATTDASKNRRKPAKEEASPGKSRRMAVRNMFEQVDEIMKQKQFSKQPSLPHFSTPQQQQQQQQGSRIATVAAPKQESQPSPRSDAPTMLRPIPSYGASPMSLFDAFPLPEAKEPRSEHALDEESCKVYLEILEPMMEQDPQFRRLHTAKPIPLEVAEPVMAWLRLEEPAVPYELASFRLALQEGVQPLDPGVERSDAFRAETTQQRALFCTRMGFSETQYKMAQGALFQAANKCAKTARGQPISVIWQKVKEAGITDKKLLHSLLYVSATFTTGSRRKRSRYSHLTGVSVLDVLDYQSTQDEQEGEEEDLVDMTDEIAIYHDMIHEPTEQSINVRIRLLVAQGKGKQAESLLHEFAPSTELRLRAYNPVLRLYLEQGDVCSALQLYRRMRSMPLVHLDVDTYVQVIAGVTEHGFFRPGSPPVAGAESLGYAPASGPMLFDQMASEMAEEIIEIPLASAKRLYNGLAKGFPQSNLEETSSLTPLQLVEEPATSEELIASRVQVDPSTGHCVRSGARLQLINLQEKEREKLKSSILELARTQQIAFEAKRNTPGGHRVHNNEKRADKMLAGFYQWMDNRNGEPFTAIVDGPNVGYYMQNFDDGKFSFHQLKFLVESLERLGERPLVIIPHKYTRRYFSVTIGVGSGMARRQYQTKEESAILESLINSGKVYVVPPGFLDDFYWILGSVSSQTNSRQGQSLFVPHDNTDGRWPGTRPLLISNDQMRDHKLGMMEPMLFRRWYSNYIVNYNFVGFVNDACSDPEIGFSPADFFSREIQGNRSGSGTAWHFPLAEWDDECFCVRIPSE